MNYLYHMVPKSMKGNELIPLNELREIHPEVYREAVKKYGGREGVLLNKIPILNCLWNDVLHLTAVHPKKIRQAFRQTGVETKSNIKWFKINPYDLNSNQGAVYLFKDWRSDRKDNYRESNFVEFDPSEVGKYNSLPKKTLDYFMSEVKHGRRPFIFNHVPHILYKGRISVGEVEVVVG